MTLKIRLKELDQLKNCFNWMGSSSALLSGFTYGAISVPTYNQLDNLWIIRFGFLAATTATMGIGLISILICSFCNIFGPGLALRGDKGSGSVDFAVKTMTKEFNVCIQFYILQLTTFFVSLFFKTVLLY